MKEKQLRQKEEIENFDLTSDASEKFLAVSTKQEPLCSLTSSSRSSTAAEMPTAGSQQNLSSSKKANAVPALRDKMPCLHFVGFANPGKLCLAPFYMLLLLLILCDFLFCCWFFFWFFVSSQTVSQSPKPWQNIPAVLCLGEVSAGTESKPSL